MCLLKLRRPYGGRVTHGRGQAVKVGAVVAVGDPFGLAVGKAGGGREAHWLVAVESIVARMGSHPQRLLQVVVGAQPMGGILVVTLQTLITGDAEQSGSDGSPGCFWQGDGGQGLRVPGGGGHRFGSFVPL